MSEVKDDIRYNVEMIIKICEGFLDESAEPILPAKIEFLVRQINLSVNILKLLHDVMQDELQTTRE